MRYQVLLFISMCFFTNCASKMLPTKYNNTDVKLTISTANDVVYDIVDVTVSFENNTASDIYLLNRRIVKTSNFSHSPWELEIFFQDTIAMFSSPVFVSWAKISGKQAYFLLPSGEAYTFTFNVDFSRLSREEERFGKTNDDFGEYTMRLIYKDRLRSYRRAFRWTVESNTIRVLYRKQ